MSADPRSISGDDMSLGELVEDRRSSAGATLDPARRRRLGQFFTPVPVAAFMSSLITSDRRPIRILEPGAGVGSLLAATIDELCSRPIRPSAIFATAVEIDPDLHHELRRTLADCKAMCGRVKVPFKAEVVQLDFLEYARRALAAQISFDTIRRPEFDLVILNPPYRKIRSASVERRILAELGIETSNLYSAFLALSALLLADRGQLIAITPRSFCNGPYFRPFRQLFLRYMTFTRIHVIESRSEAFAADGVLQENIVLHAVRGLPATRVVVTSGNGSVESQRFGRELDYSQLVSPLDPDVFIHLAPEPNGSRIAARMFRQPCDLAELGLEVSTGRVVDFRAREYLRDEADEETAPLVYPTHFSGGFVSWPKPSKKPNAIAITPATAELLVAPGEYVLVKRFSAKEERRRMVAAVFDSRRVASSQPVGFENHLNYFHRQGEGIGRDLAIGLAAYLNSTLVDLYFRQFSGHTQVNARDLRKLRYPSGRTLKELGRRIGDEFPDDQSELDQTVDALIDP